MNIHNTQENLNIPDKIILVVRPISEYKQTGMKQAFIVDPSNKKQLETARKWGKETVSDTWGISTIEPLELYLDNKDFEIELLDYAEDSCNGGKLSFWNCIVRNKDVEVIIGIEQRSILSLVQQSTVIKGIVQEKCSLAKQNTAWAVHEGMKEWNLSQQKKFNALEVKKKTTKWELGKSYTTLKKEDLYLGDIYSWFTEEEDIREVKQSSQYSWGAGKGRVAHYIYRLQDKPVNNHLILNITENKNKKKKTK